MRAAILDKSAYAAVSTPTASGLPALVVVTVAAVATGIGTFSDEGRLSGLSGLPPRVVLGLVGWVALASVGYVVGSWLRSNEDSATSWGIVARAFGLAHAPLVLRAVGVLPGLSLLIPLITAVWTFIALAVAAREALQLDSSWKSFVVALAGFAAYLLVYGGLSFLLINLEST